VRQSRIERFLGLYVCSLNTAVVAALTPICVEKFLQNSDAKANLAAELGVG
jgi:hypothetical protein